MVVAQRAGEQAGPEASQAVQDSVTSAFMSGFHLGSLAAAAVVAIGAVVAWRYLPARSTVSTPDEHAALPEAATAPAR
jgi:hypothetical protein